MQAAYPAIFRLINISLHRQRDCHVPVAQQFLHLFRGLANRHLHRVSSFTRIHVLRPCGHSLRKYRIIKVVSKPVCCPAGFWAEPARYPAATPQLDLYQIPLFLCHDDRVAVLDNEYMAKDEKTLIRICFNISRRNLAISLGVRSLCSSQVCTVSMNPAAKKLIRYSMFS